MVDPGAQRGNLRVIWVLRFTWARRWSLGWWHLGFWRTRSGSLVSLWRQDPKNGWSSWGYQAQLGPWRPTSEELVLDARASTCLAQGSFGWGWISLGPWNLVAQWVDPSEELALRTLNQVSLVSISRVVASLGSQGLGSSEWVGHPWDLEAQWVDPIRGTCTPHPEPGDSAWCPSLLLSLGLGSFGWVGHPWDIEAQWVDPSEELVLGC